MQDSRLYKSPIVTGPKLFVRDSEVFKDPKLYRSTVGALQYLILTKLDLAYIVNKLS